jgi:hypothetical protein
VAARGPYKNAIDGKIVSPEYAANNPNTTIKRKVPVNPPKESEGHASGG